MEQNRPLSPHLQWYKPQLTSVLSITHRVSGVVLALGLALVVIWIIAAGFSPTVYAAIAGLLSSWAGKILLVIISAAFSFHFANGIRHLFWDAGIGFDIIQIYRSGYLVVVITSAMTIAATIIILFGIDR